jgi:hypothetical protein
LSQEAWNSVSSFEQIDLTVSFQLALFWKTSSPAAAAVHWAAAALSSIFAQPLTICEALPDAVCPMKYPRASMQWNTMSWLFVFTQALAIPPVFMLNRSLIT